MYLFKNIVKVEVNGRNIDNYIKKIIRSKVDIIKLVRINHKKIILYTRYDDYLKLKQIRTIYNVNLLERFGRFRLFSFINKNSFLLIFIVIGIVIIYIISNVILDIEVIHSNPVIREILYKELDKNGIRKYSFKKKYLELDSIKKNILNNNKDKLEWIEIIESGTKYIIRVEERVRKEKLSDKSYQNIVASKNAVITKVIAIEGEKVKFENSYVNKGDVIITGSMLKPDNSSVLMHASGKVLGEVWYKVEVDYPYVYKEKRLTGKKKNVLVLNFLGKRVYFFNFNKFNVFNRNNNYIFKNNMLDIDVSFEKQYELNVIDEFLTEEEAVDRAIEEGKNKLLNNNDKIDSIRNVKLINKEFLSSKVRLDLFISVIEDIGVEEEIKLSENNN